MDVSRAKEILTTLTEGVNPITGELLPPNDSCNQGDVLRALQTAVQIMEKTSKTMRSTPENAGKPWTENEAEQLRQEYESGMKISAIAKEHGRSTTAIQSRLSAMGLAEMPYIVRIQKQGN